MTTINEESGGSARGNGEQRYYGSWKPLPLQQNEDEEEWVGEWVKERHKQRMEVKFSTLSLLHGH